MSDLIYLFIYLFTPPPALSEPDRLCAETQESVDELLLRDGNVSAIPSKKRDRSETISLSQRSHSVGDKIS